MGDILKEVKNLFRIRGKTREDTLENISFIVIVFAAVLIAFGMGLGTFYKGVILLASFGSFLLLIGIIIFVIAELMRG